MKLGELKSEIRTMKGNPKVTVPLPNGFTIDVFVQKTSIMPELDRVYGARNTETGLYLSDDGLIVDENAPVRRVAVAVDDGPSLLDLMGPATDDLDDLIG